LARHGVAVYSPDEAASNRLAACLAAGLVTEVLAEEVCAAWTWGAVEAGQAAAFASYEAFAPLAGSLLAQYAKLTHARPPRNTPPLLVLSTSLGWANAPTHQNTDLAGMLLARPQPRVEVVYPVGAASAAKRLAWLVTGLTDGAALVTCSKQPLLDPPDPGGSAVRYELAGAPPPTGCLIAIGDVCVTEAIAATVIAAGLDVALAVIAVIDLKHAVPALAGMASWLAGRPVAAAAWCAPAYAKPLLWEGAGRIIPLRGYEERWAPTAWETLRRNGLDRISLLHALAGEGVDLPAGGLRAAAAAQDVDGTSSLETVPRFDCPALWASPVHGQPGELTFGERAEAGGHL
jgi:xylulose-5-phosphate/fructose-6-phosphate phosphoketolase